jgi:hypothetical protein
MTGFDPVIFALVVGKEDARVKRGHDENSV